MSTRRPPTHYKATKGGAASRTPLWRARTDNLAPTVGPCDYIVLEDGRRPWKVYRTERERTLYVSACGRLAVVQSPVGKAWLATVGRSRLPGYSRTPHEAARKARAAWIELDEERVEQRRTEKSML